MNSDPIDRRTLLTRLAAAFSAAPALLAAKGHPAPASGAPDDKTPAPSSASLPARETYTEYHYDHQGRLVTMVKHQEGQYLKSEFAFRRGGSSIIWRGSSPSSGGS